MVIKYGWKKSFLTSRDIDLLLPTRAGSRRKTPGLRTSICWGSMQSHKTRLQGQSHREKHKRIGISKKNTFN